MDEGPGVLLRDGRREDFEDLAEVETVVRVEGAGVPHDYTITTEVRLTSELFNPLCPTGNISAKK